MGSALLTTALLVTLLLGGGGLACIRLQERASWLEWIVTRIVIGAATLPVLQIAAYELLGVPMRPWIAAVLGGIGLPFVLFDGWRRWQSRAGSPAREPSSHRAILVLLTIATFWSILKGALAFSSFEGRDPWGHALGAKYIMEVGIPRQPFPDWPILHYIDAYPPLFDTLLSLACWLGGAVNAPLKTVAALAAGLALPCFYYLVLRLLNDPCRAAVATALWAVLPGNLTRHLWAHSLALVFTFAAIHTVLRLRSSWRWLAPGAVLMAGLILTAPTAAINGLALVLIGAAVLWRTSRLWAWRTLVQCGLALVLASVWYAPAFARYGSDLRLAMEHPQTRRDRARHGASDPVAKPEATGARMKMASEPAGNAAPQSQHYGVDDFLFFRPYALGGLLRAPKFTEEIAPIGLGLPVAILALLFMTCLCSRHVKRRASTRTMRRTGMRLLGFWLAGVLALALGPWWGFDFYAWRAWLLLCPLACAAAAETLFWLTTIHAPLRRGGSWLAVLSAILVAVCVLNALGAVTWDFLGSIPSRAYWSHGEAPGPENPVFFLKMNPTFAIVVLGAVWLGFTALAGRVRLRIWKVAAFLVVAAHVVIATPIRLRTLTRLIQPLGYASTLEYRGYLLTLNDTRPGDRIFPLSGADRAQFLIGLDRECSPWNSEERRMTQRFLSPKAFAASDLVAWLQRSSYLYVIIDPSCRRELLDAGADARQYEKRASQVASAPGLTPVLRLTPDGAEENERESFLLLRVEGAALR